MVTLINAPAPKKNIWGRLGASAGQGLEEGMEQSRQSQMAQQLAGQKRQADTERLEREFELKSQFEREKRQSKIDELSGKKQEQIQNFDNALNTVDQMLDLGKKGNLGIGSSFLKYFSPERQKDIGAYETLGKSLIQYVSQIPIRNKAEFEVLAEDLFNPSLPDKQREGILEKMRDLIKKSRLSTSGEQTQERPPLSSFER